MAAWRQGDRLGTLPDQQDEVGIDQGRDVPVACRQQQGPKLLLAGRIVRGTAMAAGNGSQEMSTLIRAATVRSGPAIRVEQLAGEDRLGLVAEARSPAK